MPVRTRSKTQVKKRAARKKKRVCKCRSKAVRMRVKPSRRAQKIKSQFFKISKSGKTPVWNSKLQRFVTRKKKKT